MEKVVRLRIVSGVLPISLGGKSDHGLVNGDAFRTLIHFGLQTRLLNPITNGRTSTLDIEYLKMESGILHSLIRI